MSAKKVENPVEETPNSEEKNEEIIKEDKVKEVEAKKVIVEEGTSKKVRLKVLIAFTDKYTAQEYKVNDVISVEEERAKELLADPRRLVEKLK